MQLSNIVSKARLESLSDGLFSIVLTLLIASVVWVVFRYFAAQPTAVYHAQSMVAKYQLVEHNFKRPVKKLPFHYLVERQPKPSNELQFYWKKVKEEIQRILPQGVQIAHDERGEEVYLWIESAKGTDQWVGLQLSQNRVLSPYYGWTYILTILALFIIPSYIFFQSHFLTHLMLPEINGWNLYAYM